jgi:hypothetical protein
MVLAMKVVIQLGAAGAKYLPVILRILSPSTEYYAGTIAIGKL